MCKDKLQKNCVQNIAKQSMGQITPIEFVEYTHVLMYGSEKTLSLPSSGKSVSGAASMIRILGIVGSPRVRGNTDKLVAEALKAAKEDGAKTELLRLALGKIQPCDACENCKKMGECRIKDDFGPIFDKMVDADGIILATPVYFGSATPQIKALIDRAGYLSVAKGRVFENKVGGALVVARRAGHNFTLAQLLFFFLHQGMIIPGSTYWNIAFGRERGEVSKDEEGLRAARNFGKKMVWLIRKTKCIE